MAPTLAARRKASALEQPRCASPCARCLRKYTAGEFVDEGGSCCFIRPGLLTKEFRVRILSLSGAGEL